jgi:histidine triad (HIT) family protein
MNELSEKNCIFCKIIAKEIPATMVYEDAGFFAFMDMYPASAGHTLIIPKKHYRWVWETPDVGTYFEVARKIAIAQQKAFNQPAIWSIIKGDEVPHAHISIMPHSDTPGDKKDLVENAKKIIDALK